MEMHAHHMCIDIVHITRDSLQVDLTTFPSCPAGEIKESPSRVKKWSEAVIVAATMEESALASHREDMVEWARERYRWGRVADGIAEMIRKDVSSGRDGACGEPIWQVRTKDPETGETCDAKPEEGSAE